MSQHLINIHSNVAQKSPQASQLDYGEIAINYNSASPKIFIKNSANNIVEFIDKVGVENLVNTKQDIISDISTIRSNATNGNTAYGWGNHANAGYQAAATAINTGNIGNQSVAYATNAGKVNNHTVEKDVPSDAKFTDTTYGVATTSANGLMSSTDKSKLNGIADGANKYTHPSDGANTGSFGPASNVSPGYGGTFSVPYVTVNAAGHVTGASTKTITLPASDNTTYGLTSSNATVTLTPSSGSASSITVNNVAKATAADHVVSAVTFSAGTFGSNVSYSGNTAPTVNIPTHTSHLTNNSDFTTKAYVDGLVASPVNYRGAITNATLPASGSTKVGDLYIVQTSAITLTATQSATGAAQTAEPGDYIIARTKATWDVIQKNINNAVTGKDATAFGDGKIIVGTGSGQVVSASTYTIAKSVPSDAVFTDTHDTNVAGTGISVSGTRGNTIAISSSYQTNIANGQTAYGWGNHASVGYAVQGAHNNLTANDNEFTFAPSGFSGPIYLNYRTAGGLNGNITDYYFSDGKGGMIGSLSTIVSNATNGNTAYGWGNHANAGYQAAATAINTGNIGNQSVAYAANAGKVNNHTVEKDVPSDAKFTDTTYGVATTSANGLMSSTDKSKLNGIADGATNVTTTTVSGWGFTKNTGTVTSVAVKMNGVTKGTITTTGTIDLGTVLTEHQSISGKADKANITAGTAGTSSATSGSSLSVPYVTMNAQGIVTGYGTHTHTVTGFGTYSKPSGGIPKTDLASAVQTSLGKADSALQNSNIVTTISSGATNSQVPSAKAVYDAIIEIDKVIAAALNDLNRRLGALEVSVSYLEESVSYLKENLGPVVPVDPVD